MKLLRFIILIPDVIMYSNIKYKGKNCTRLKYVQQNKKVHEANDQEKVQLGRKTHSKNRGEKKLN